MLWIYCHETEQNFKARNINRGGDICKGKQVHSIKDYIIMINMHAINNIASIYKLKLTNIQRRNRKFSIQFGDCDIYLLVDETNI